MKKKDETNKAKDNLEDINDLYRQLYILNLSLETIYIVIIAIFLNIEFIKWSRIKILDSINNTKNLEKVGDLSDYPKISNLIYIYATGVFLLINYSEFQNISSLEGSTKKERCKGFKAFLSSLLIFIATGLTKDNLET